MEPTHVESPADRSGTPLPPGVDPRAVAPTTVVIEQRSTFARWLTAISLAVIAVCLVARLDNRAGSNWALAQPVRSAGAHGIFAFTGQLAKDYYGVFMVDVDAGTIWCYRYLPSRNVLKLEAARDWRYDRYLTEHATEPPPEFVQQMLEQQRQAAMRQGGP